MSTGSGKLPLELQGQFGDGDTEDLDQSPGSGEVQRRAFLVQDFADSLPQMAWLVTADGRTEWFNRRFYEYTGVAPETSPASGWQAVIHPQDLPALANAWRRALGEVRAFVGEARLRAADGGYRWFQVNSRPRVDAGGKLLRWYGTATDIDDRKKAERASADSEARFRGLADNMVPLAWIADGSGAIVWYNRRWFEYTGTTREELGNWDWTTVQHPQHVQRVIKKFKRHVRSGRDWEDTFPLRGADGGYRWFLARATPTRDAEGKVVRWFGTNTDITDQREAAIALEASEDRLAGAMALARMATYVIEFPGQQVHCDVRMTELWGLKDARSLDLPQVLDAVHSDHRDYVISRIAAALDPAGNGLYDAEARVVGIDDRVVRWIHSRARVEFADGAPRRMIGFSFDISERKAAETAQAERIAREHRDSERMRLIAESSLKIHAAAQSGSVVATVTEEARRLISAHQAIGISVIDGDWSTAFTHTSLSDKHAGNHAQQAPLDDSGVYRLVCQSNRPLRMKQSELEAHPAWSSFAAAHRYPPMRGCLAVPFVGKDGGNLGLILLSDRIQGEFSVDDEALLTQLASITSVAIENSRLYIQLREADRRKDEFLATLAHELRNPLAPISSALQMLKHAGGDAASIAHAQSLMERQVSNLVRLVDDLLEVSRITQGKFDLRREPLDLAEVLNTAIETARPRLQAAQHRLVVDLPEEKLQVNGDPLRLSQVFTNLLNNAAKYTPRGGEVRLKAWREDGEIVASVRDSGVGIPSEMLPRVFDMFAQVDRNLRGAQDGLGIGLAIVQRLLAMHGGTVVAASAGAGQGAEFLVRLPFANDASTVSVPAALQAPVLPRPILIVDDNRDAADSLAALLELLGGECHIAYDGESAMAMLPHVQPSVALLDLGMPGVDGFELARRIRLHPQGASVRLIALSGWGQDEDKRRSRMAGFDAHLVKPVDIDGLLALLAQSCPREAA